MEAVSKGHVLTKAEQARLKAAPSVQADIRELTASKQPRARPASASPRGRSESGAASARQHKPAQSASTPRPMSARPSRKPPLDNGRSLGNRGASAQCIAAKKSAPSYGFGSATREQANKLFVSQEHTLIATGGTASPGPAHYLLPASVGGKQPDGRKKDPPTWSFGGADRFLYGYGKPTKGPGPEEYTMHPSVGGKQPDGARANAPEYGFGTSTREQVKKLFISQQHTLTILAGTQGPGPAKYNLPASVGGKQPDGRKKDPPTYSFGGAARTTIEPGLDTPAAIYEMGSAVGASPRGTPKPEGKIAQAPAYGFGAATREQAGKVFVSQEQTALAPPNVPTPGPAAPYNLAAAIGDQPSSRYKTQPRMAFSKESRWRVLEAELKRNTVPGPGAYG